MAIEYRGASGPGCGPFEAEVPAGAIVGLTGGDEETIVWLLGAAAGRLAVVGEVVAPGSRVLLAGREELEPGPVGALAIEHAFARRGLVDQARLRMAVEEKRRQGAAVLLASSDLGLLESMCDEVWWVEGGRIVRQGEPREVIEAYQRESAAALREWAAGAGQTLAPSLRRGDGRARLELVETLDAAGGVVSVWRNGERAAVRVRVRFESEVADPVVGIMIRTRIGFEVYGTNTELEGVKLGPVGAGEAVEVLFEFGCALCGRDYTITAASHDRDGVWHDWLEDAVAVTVAGKRYTAGVADLGARVTASRVGRA